MKLGQYVVNIFYLDLHKVPLHLYNFFLNLGKICHGKLFKSHNVSMQLQKRIALLCTITSYDYDDTLYLRIKLLKSQSKWGYIHYANFTSVQKLED